MKREDSETEKKFPLIKIKNNLRFNSLTREPPKVQGPSATGLLPAPTQLALLSPICFPDLKAESWQRAATLDDS